MLSAFSELSHTWASVSVKKKIMVAITVVTLIMLIHSYWAAFGDIDAGLYGFWEVDEEFAERAELDAMYLYVAPPGGKATNNIGPLGARCQIYALIRANGDIIFNELVNTSIRRASYALGGLYSYDVDFGKELSIIPRKVVAEYDAVAGMLTLRSKKTTYARLFKKTEASFHCTMRPELPEDEDDDEDDDEPADDDGSSD
jgi:hypothetical protein